MLQVERLTKRYGAIVGIDDVSFIVRPGEVLGLLGPNGSGKSTTVKILTGLLDQTFGHVLLDGKDVATDILQFKTHIGYVPEEPYLYSYLTGPEYVLLVGRLRGLRDLSSKTKSNGSCGCSASTTTGTTRWLRTRKGCGKRS